MAWIMLIFAGLLEVGWAFTIKLSNGFTNLGYSTIMSVAASLMSAAWPQDRLPAIEHVRDVVRQMAFIEMGQRECLCKVLQYQIQTWRCCHD